MFQTTNQLAMDTTDIEDDVRTEHVDCTRFSHGHVWWYTRFVKWGYPQSSSILNDTIFP